MERLLRAAKSRTLTFELRGNRDVLVIPNGAHANACRGAGMKLYADEWSKALRIEDMVEWRELRQEIGTDGRAVAAKKEKSLSDDKMNSLRQLAMDGKIKVTLDAPNNSICLSSFSHKNAFKAVGFQWNPERKAWTRTVSATEFAKWTLALQKTQPPPTVTTPRPFAPRPTVVDDDAIDKILATADRLVGSLERRISTRSLIFDRCHVLGGL